MIFVLRCVVFFFKYLLKALLLGLYEKLKTSGFILVRESKDQNVTYKNIMQGRLQ
jgi:hypothetical protein